MFGSKENKIIRISARCPSCGTTNPSTNHTTGNSSSYIKCMGCGKTLYLSDYE